MPKPAARTESAAEPPAWLGVVRRAVAGLDDGEVQILAQDDRVGQMERRGRSRPSTGPQPAAR